MPEYRTRESDREYAYNALKAAICNGEILPGERIVEMTYANMLNVSRTPIREAIRMLEQDGLIEFTPKRGAIARRLPTDDVIEQIYSIRKAIQLTFAKRTIECMSEEQLAAMEACNRACQDALAADDMATFFENYDQSNFILQDGAQVPLATTVLDLLNNYEPISSLSSGFSHTTNSRLREAALPDVSRRKAAVNEHVKIAAAIRARDEGMLKKALTVHVENAKRACFTGVHHLREQYHYLYGSAAEQLGGR